MTAPAVHGLTGPEAVVADLLAAARENRRYDIGFPGATDLTFMGLAEVLTGQLLNNIGDPFDVGRGRNHTKQLEQQVVTTVADILGAPAGAWGYVTTGSTEGTLHALDEAWQRYPDLVVYTSAAAHYSVAKGARLLKLPLVMVRTDPTGRIDVADLAGEIARRRDRPAMVVATAGTTMTEAVDDVGAIAAACDDLAVARRRIHVDAALSGIPLALLPPETRPAFGFGSGATSMVVSGHKFLSTLVPCGVLVYATAPHLPAGGRIAYTGSADTTITGSRSGHTPLLLWWALTTLGVDGLRRRAQASRDLAAYTHGRLRGIGWPTQLLPHAFTVTLAEPPPSVLAKWVLASDGQTAHIVCMPGTTGDQIDEFVTDLAAARPPTSPPSVPSPTARVPRTRSHRTRTRTTP
ncbi:pyridoxal-dependent decarboxylase [Solwaraspora sp. WMMD1047]|uniref:pyridoxal-dependent decarboxylase n=1 Tax=Solwaraspora sp. WMMD1047 TaxID=3016102 RepID=UPI0024180043|nr:pyridoxal-dependent decarboxylase [Solwaraspora sp. WMMD1047]MDG4834099.1 pyridoxal-dependent decarboxylase [Solwaraspora sp. WMMD1047]